jgi:hypothetical protein
MKSVLLIGALLGLVLYVLSFFWTQLFPGTSTWTPEKAEQWATVKDRLHNLSFIVNAPPGSEPPRRHPNYEAAKEEYDKVKAVAQQLQAEFESAYNAPRTTSTVLKWSGVGLFVVGAVGWYVMNQRSA